MKIIRRIALILGTFVAGTMFYLTFSEFMIEIRAGSPTPIITLIDGQYFLAVTMTIVFLGLVLSYWKELIGGGISLTAMMVFIIGWNDWHAFFLISMFIMMLAPALYVIHGVMRLRHGKQETGDTGPI